MTDCSKSQLIQAVRNQQIEITAKCLAKGVDPDCTDEGSMTPLMAAVGAYDYYDDRRGSVRKRDPIVDQLITLLIDVGASVDLGADMWPVKGYTPLIFAIALYP